MSSNDSTLEDFPVSGNFTYPHRFKNPHFSVLSAGLAIEVPPISAESFLNGCLLAFSEGLRIGDFVEAGLSFFAFSTSDLMEIKGLFADGFKTGLFFTQEATSLRTFGTGFDPLDSMNALTIHFSEGVILFMPEAIFVFR